MLRFDIENRASYVHATLSGEFTLAEYAEIVLQRTGDWLS